MEQKLLFQLILQCSTRWNFVDLKSHNVLLEAPRNRPADRLKTNAEVCMSRLRAQSVTGPLTLYSFSSHG